MGEGMSYQFRRLLDERRLMRVKPDRKLVLKETEGTASDLEDARDSLSRGKVKWATFQGYFSMFHSVRALVYSRGYREKSHYALLVALRELFNRELGVRLIDRFEEGMDLRQEADYGLRFSEESALFVVESAEEFLSRARQILKLPK